MNIFSFNTIIAHSRVFTGYYKHCFGNWLFTLLCRRVKWLVHKLLHFASSISIISGHYQQNQCCPSREWVISSTVTIFIIVMFPQESGLFVLFGHICQQIVTQLNMQFGAHFLIWSIQQGIMFQSGNRKIVPGINV